ncbi:hypothetical protein BGY98DRAFT_1118592, partial [Russula aff. rugulosa BPL654]
AVPCDERGVPLQKINGLFAEPPPPKPKAVDDWSPSESREHFTLAELIFCDTRMSAANTSKLMAIVADFRQGEPPFKDHSDLCNTIDASDLGDVLWQNAILRYTGEILDGQVPEWMKAEYEIYYRDPRDVIKNMMADTTFKHAFDYVPYQEFDEDRYRRYENLMSGDWAFHQANIIAEDKNTHGAMFVPIILGSDKTVVSVATGNNEFWPLYMSIGNVHNKVRRAHGNAVVLIGFLCIPKILSSLEGGMTVPKILQCPDGHFSTCYIWAWTLHR